MMESNKNQMMLFAIISFFTFILSLSEGAETVLPPYTIPSDPYRDPTSPLPSLSPPPCDDTDFQPVPSPDDQTSDISPSYYSREYENFPIPSFWTRPLLGSSSAPSPSANPPSQVVSPLSYSSKGQMSSKGQLSRTIFSRNSINSAVSSAKDPEIKKICSATDSPDLCVSFLTPLFRKGNTDTLSVLEKAINATGHQIRMAMIGMELLIRGGRNRGLVKECKESFKDALENLQTAREAIPRRDIGTINSMLSAAVTDFSDCDDLTDQPPISTFDDVLTDLVSTCLVIASSIK